MPHPVPDISQVPEPQKYIIGAFLHIMNVITGFEKRLPLSPEDEVLYMAAQECRRNLEQLNK